MAVVVAMAVMQRRARLWCKLSAAGVVCSLAAAWRQVLLLLNELRHQQLSKRLPAQRLRAFVQLTDEIKPPQSRLLDATRTIWTRFCTRLAALIAPRDADKRTSAAQRGSRPRLVSSRSSSHLSPRKQRRRRYHPLSVVQQLLSTTGND